jgi:hypothetical protein
MTAAALVLSARTRIERLFDALVDPARREHTMLVVLASYFAIWSLYATISRSSQDFRTDMGEFVACSREVGLGSKTSAARCVAGAGLVQCIPARRRWSRSAFI